MMGQIMAGSNQRVPSRHRKTALALAAKAWYVFPLHNPVGRKCSCGKDTRTSPAKHPRTPNGLKDFTVEEFSLALRVNLTTVKRWIAKGLVRASQLPGGAYRIPREELARFRQPVALEK